MSECFGRYKLTGWVLDDLDPDSMRAVGDHLESCEHCHRIVEEIQANMSAYQENDDDHLQALQTAMETVDREQAGRQPARLSGWQIWVPVATAALAIAVILWQVLPQKTDLGIEDDQIQFKGSIGLQVIAQRGQRQFEVWDGQHLEPGDRLRLIVTTPSAGFLTVFSLDSQGRLSALFPGSHPSSQPAPLHLVQPGRHELPDAVQMDNLPGEEALVVFFARESFDRQSVHQRIRSVVSSSDRDEWKRMPRERGGSLIVLRFKKGTSPSQTESGDQQP
jgi:hypothetical protein